MSGLKHCFAFKRKYCFIPAASPPAHNKAMLTSVELARRVREAMESHDPPVRPAELATACGVSPQAITGWLSTGRIAKRHLSVIAALTERQLGYFLDDAAHVAEPPATYLTEDERSLIELYRKAAPRWRLSIRLLAQLRSEVQDDVSESVNILLAKIAADPATDGRLEETYGFPPKPSKP